MIKTFNWDELEKQIEEQKQKLGTSIIIDMWTEKELFILKKLKLENYNARGISEIIQKLCGRKRSIAAIHTKWSDIRGIHDENS